MTRLLLVDEDRKTLNILSTLLRTEGYKIIPLLALEKALEFIKSQQFDLMIFDICRKMDVGIEVLRKIRDERADLPVIVITDSKSDEYDEKLSSLKFVEVVEKPFKVNEFLLKVQDVIDSKSSAHAGAVMATQPFIEMVDGVEDIIARSPAMRKVCEMIKRVGPTEIAVLIQGERGTDKEQVARAIHASSQNRGRQFILFDCVEISDESAINLKLFGCAKGSSSADQDGLIETADNGTLFLDNVDALPISTQEKLYNVLMVKAVSQEGEGGVRDIPVNVRILAGTSVNLAGKAQTGAFQKELYRMLSVIPIQLKPLRECKEDIAPLVDQLLRKESESGKNIQGCNPDALSAFERYPWPGNVEELRKVVRDAVNNVSGNILTKQNLPPEVLSAGAS